MQGALRCLLPLALLTTGCAEIQYQTTTTHDEVISTSTRRVPAGQEATLETDATRLTVHTRRLCSLVEDKEIERDTVREPDEEIYLEVGLMAGSALPLAAGTALVVDSQNVYDDDPNQRLYNRTGPDTPLGLGIASLVVGAAMFLPATVSLIRKTAPDYESEIVHEQGDVLRTSIPCRDQGTLQGLAVMGRLDNGASVSLGATDAGGTLTVDLATVLSPSYFGGPTEPFGMEVVIGGQGYGTIDLSEVVAMHERRRDRAWRQADPDRCERERSEVGCSGVRLFVQTHGGSYRAREGEALLALIGQPVLAVDPNRARCERACMTRCESDTACAARCVQEICR